jgi:CBS domain-containing protein
MAEAQPIDLDSQSAGGERILKAMETDPVSSLVQGPVVTIGLDATIQEAVECLQEKHIGCVLVSGSDGRLAGIFTERDLLNRVAGRRLDWRSVRVADYMTRDPESLRPDDRIVWALNLMHVGGYRHVPLVDASDRPVGIVSVKDIVSFLVELFPSAVLNLPPDPHRAPDPTLSGGGED